MVHISCGDYYDILSIVVGSVIVSQLVDSKSSNKVSITLDWLAHHVLSIDIVVRVFKSKLLESGMVCFELVSNFNLQLFKLRWVQLHVADGITKHLDGLCRVSLMSL